MKNIFRIFIIALALSFVLSAASCGYQNDFAPYDDTSGSSGSQQTESNPDTDIGTDEAPEPDETSNEATSAETETSSQTSADENDSLIRPEGSNAYSVEKLLDFRYTEHSGENVQGTAIYGNYMIQLCHSGRARIFDLESADPGTPLDTFELGSYTGSTAGAAANHANQCMFGAQKWAESDPLPLLYVTIGNGAGDKSDGTGYHARCAVERITVDKNGNWKAQLVQVISVLDTEYRPQNSAKGMTLGTDGVKRFIYRSVNGFTNTENYQVISWGWPAFFVDSDPTDATKNKLYIHSARFRTKDSIESSNMSKYDIPEYSKSNAYIITGFELPALPESLPVNDQYALDHPAVLSPKDITDQFETAYDIYFTQGGTMYQGKIYYSFGSGGTNEKRYDAIRIYDISEKKQVCRLDLRAAPFAEQEPECCCIYNGKLALSTQKKQVYLFTAIDY